MANLKFFLENDAPAARRFHADLPALAAAKDRLVVAAGTSSKGLWIRGCAQALADALELPLAETPGGHAGYVAHPRGFAARLRQLLTP
ncbi:MAG: hypothetical protein JNK82_42875 [Myxococcaceae bacterium]|nr:hypothetical protein [Myxococcaceae bacterium]